MSFESVKTGTIWNPMQDSDKKPLQPTDKSYLIGYYMGSEQKSAKNGDPYTLHSVRSKDVGGVETVEKVSFFGTKILNDALEVMEPGSLIKVVWLGKVQPEKEGAREYHDWDILVDRTVEPMGVDTTPASETEESLDKPVAAQKNNPSKPEDATDDLPF